jgi:hypothetical protein
MYHLMYDRIGALSQPIYSRSKLAEIKLLSSKSQRRTAFDRHTVWKQIMHSLMNLIICDKFFTVMIDAGTNILTLVPD